ncbi:hypothetical protein KKD37_03475 [Patescibacteria group bacterium]|nr:hypothetical protein [Patescibacteria group bacterium]
MNSPFDPRDPFSNLQNKVTSRWGEDGDGNPQFNQHIFDPESPDYNSHRGYVIGTGRQFQAGTERRPRPNKGS